MKKFFIISAFALCQGIYAQSQGVIYFDEDWNVIEDKKKAAFYRETTQQGDFYLVKDYYIDGTLQMEGKTSDKTPNQEVFEGKVTWYYPNGEVSSISHFSKGVPKGEHKSYDIIGRIQNDFIYKNNDVFIGKSYSYEDDYQNNMITEYKNGEIVKVTAYGKSLQGIRYEEIYNDGYGSYIPSETRYYDENGKYMGNYKKQKNGNYTGIKVQYYTNPMKISCIDTYTDASASAYTNPSETQCYYGNGKRKKIYKSNGKTASEEVYDENGEKIGQLEYRYDEEMDGITPYNGEKIEIDLYEKNKKISSITNYKKGVITEYKTFDSDGSIQNQYFYDDDYRFKEVWSFKDGKHVLTYRDGLPYNGRFILEENQSYYKDGVLIETKETDWEGYPIFEKKYDEGKKVYQVKIYSKNKPKYYYTMNVDEDNDDLFTAEITPFDEKGNPMSKVIVKDGKIEKGTLRIKSPYDFGTVEYSKKGKWYIIRTYDEKQKLRKEERYKEDYPVDFEIHREMLRYE